MRAAPQHHEFFVVNNKKNNDGWVAIASITPVPGNPV